MFGGESKKKGIRGWWEKKKRKGKKKEGCVRGWWEKKGKIIIIIINNIIIKFKSKKQNEVSNIISFLNYNFSYKTKTMYQTEFFLQS